MIGTASTSPGCHESSGGHGGGTMGEKEGAEGKKRHSNSSSNSSGDRSIRNTKKQEEGNNINARLESCAGNMR